jgi:hypothetical protein
MPVKFFGFRLFLLFYKFEKRLNCLTFTVSDISISKATGLIVKEELKLYLNSD